MSGIELAYKLVNRWLKTREDLVLGRKATSFLYVVQRAKKRTKFIDAERYCWSRDAYIELEL